MFVFRKKEASLSPGLCLCAIISPAGPTALVGLGGHHCSICGGQSVRHTH